MTQIGPQYQGPVPQGAPRQPYPQPVVYRPGQMTGAPVMVGDSYRPGMPPTAPGRPGAGRPGSVAPPEPEVEYVSKKDVAFGLLGAGAGYFLAPMIGLTGPIGAIILGIALLGISAAGRAMKRSSAKKQQQQMQPPPQQMPQPPQYPNPQQHYQNQYNYQMDPNTMQDPRYRYPGQ